MIEKRPDAAPVQDSVDDAVATRICIEKSLVSYGTPIGLSEYPRPHKSAARIE